MKKSKYILYFLHVTSLIFVFYGCISYPDRLKANFQLAGKNRNELKKVIRHYSFHPSDSLKRKAAIFLIENMDVHYSYLSESWERFQVELDTLFCKEEEATKLSKGFNSLYDKYADRLRDIVYLSDLKSISSKFIIYNIEHAFQVWKMPYCNYLNFNDFCEYILPYRVGVEPISEWRDKFSNTFLPNLYNKIEIKKDSLSVYEICNALKNYPYKTIVFFPSEIPDYNAHMLSKMKLGSCRQFSLQAALAARSVGVPVALDYTPQWATRSFSHEWNALITKENKPLSFGIGDYVDLGKHIEIVPDRIPAKIYRETFAKQPLSLALIHGDEEIPPTLNSPCFRDVTKDYYETVDILVTPLTKISKCNFAYLSVFDNLNWIPIAWAKTDGNNYFFQNINKGIVCLPSYYYQTRIIPMAYPILIRNDGSRTILKPDPNNRKSVILKRKYQDRMGSFRGFAMLGGRFQVANDPSFKDAIDIAKVSVKPEQYYHIENIELTSEYKYFRYLSPKGSHGEIAEIEVYEEGINDKIKGKYISNHTPKTGYSLANVFDSAPLTRYSTVEADDTWVGLEFNTPKKINKLVYLPFNDGNCICDSQQYELFYWDNKWISLGKQNGSNKTYRLVYNNIPDNSLLLLRNLTEGVEERIFTYENGEQVWW